MLNNTSVKYEQPNDINIILKNHQLAMLYKCMEIEKKSNICIMRDKPGAGKTYVILSFINISGLVYPYSISFITFD